MEREYVGIDFHRRRSVVVRISPAGEQPEVVIEATYGWYWAVDVLQQLGATVHLANPKR